jgi:hypothetical protein
MGSEQRLASDDDPGSDSDELDDGLVREAEAAVLEPASEE